MKTANPPSVRAVIDEARRQDVPADIHLAPSTVDRLRAREGLFDRDADQPVADRRRFAHRHAGRTVDERCHARPVSARHSFPGARRGPESSRMARFYFEESPGAWYAAHSGDVVFSSIDLRSRHYQRTFRAITTGHSNAA